MLDSWLSSLEENAMYKSMLEAAEALNITCISLPNISSKYVSAKYTLQMCIRQMLPTNKGVKYGLQICYNSKHKTCVTCHVKQNCFNIKLINLL